MNKYIPTITPPSPPTKTKPIFSNLAQKYPNILAQIEDTTNNIHTIVLLESDGIN